MTSAIDPTKPDSGTAYTADVRANFQTAADEISALQDATASAYSAGGTSEYTWGTSITPPPASRWVEGDNADQTQIAILNVDKTTRDGVDATTVLGLIKAGDVLYLQDRNTAANFRAYNCTASGTDQGSYISVPVAYRAGGGNGLTNGQDILVSRLAG